MVELHGYFYSVYTRIVRIALIEKGVQYCSVEVDPFAETVSAEYLALHPFSRVPTLVHDGFVVYETAAITRYVDEAFAGPSLQARDPRARASMNQVVSIIDSYGYWPMVRQVFSHRVFRPRLGERGSDERSARVSRRPPVYCEQSSASPVRALISSATSSPLRTSISRRCWPISTPRRRAQACFPTTPDSRLGGARCDCATAWWRPIRG